jgi:hypothetical protein
VVDLVKMKAIVWNGEELGAKFEEQDIPADLQELANEYREKLIEGVVEQDDAVSLWILFPSLRWGRGGGELQEAAIVYRSNECVLGEGLCFGKEKVGGRKQRCKGGLRPFVQVVGAYS